MATTTIAVTTTVFLPEERESWQVQDLEGRFHQAGLEAARMAYAQALYDYEAHLLKQHPEWDRKERPVKKIATSLGEIRYQRYRVWDRQLGKSRYPLDEVLGMKEKEKVSRDYKHSVMEQAVQRSYRQSAKEVKRQSFVKRSAMSQWRLVQQTASEKRARKQQSEKIVDWKRNLLPDSPRLNANDPCPALGIDLDDTYCRSWKTKKLLKDHNVRVAVLYRHKERVSKHRWKLKDKTVVTSGPGEILELFLNRVTQTAITHYGLHDKTKIVVHGDGDPQIRNYALRFPRALYRLDPWHVQKKIKEAFGFKLLPESWYEDIYGKPDSLISKIKLYSRQFADDDTSKEKINALIQYLENNKEGLLPSGVSQTIKQKYPRLFLRGSGTIERNIAWTVNERFKLPRMSWSQNGLENLLFLREAYLNTEVQPKFKPQPGTPPDYFCLN